MYRYGGYQGLEGGGGGGGEGGDGGGVTFFFFFFSIDYLSYIKSSSDST